MRIRITFAKAGALRYIGHLDLHRMWERVTRRAGLSLSYTQGFHPQPKIQLAAALPLGFSSRCELVDMWVDGPVDLESLPNKLQESVPPGLTILAITSVEEKGPPLQTQILSSEYEIDLLQGFDSSELEPKISNTLSASTLPRERRGKAYDLRPLIEQLEFAGPERLVMRLAAREGATGRPEEVLDVLGVHLEDVKIERTLLIFKRQE